MFSFLSLGFIELIVVALCWATTGAFYVWKSPRVVVSAFASFVVTVAALITPADILSSIVLAILLTVAFAFGMKHQQRHASA